MLLDSDDSADSSTLVVPKEIPMKRPRSPSASPEANDEPHQPQPAKKSAIK